MQNLIKIRLIGEDLNIDKIIVLPAVPREGDTIKIDPESNSISIKRVQFLAYDEKMPMRNLKVPFPVAMQFYPRIVIYI